MMPSIFSLRPTCRIMLAIWLALLVGISALVAGATHTPISGNLLAFLLTRSPDPVPVMQVSQPAQAQPQETATPAAAAALPLATPAMPPEPAPIPTPEWRPVPRGKKQGNGTLSSPEIVTLSDGSVQVIFTYTGENGKPADPGSVTSNKASARATSVDLHGAWKRLTYVSKSMGANSILSRLQVAEHTGYVRVSATARNAAPKETTEYTADRIRITFSPQAGVSVPSTAKEKP